MKNRKWLEEIRKAQGFRYRYQLTELLPDVSVSHYTKIERGERKPSMHVAFMIADRLDFDVRLFFEYDNYAKEGAEHEKMGI